MIDENLSGESQNLASILNDPTILIVAHLSKLPIQDDPGVLTLAEMLECDFPGYTPWLVTNWDIEQIEDDEAGEAISEPIQFANTEPNFTQAATGMYLTIQRVGEDPVLWQFFFFDEPFPFVYEGHPFEVQLRIDSYDETLTPA